MATDASRYRRAVLVLGVGCMAASGSLRATDPLLPRLAEEFATTPGSAALATTAFFIGYGLLQFVHGPIGDRYGKVRVIAIQAALAALATLGCALSPGLDALVLARLVAGMFVGAVIPLSLAWIGDVVPYAQRQAVLAKLTAWMICGTALGLSAGGWFAENLSWRGSFFMFAALFGVSSVLLAFEWRANPVARAAAGTARRAGVIGLLRDRWVRIIFGIVFFEAMVSFAALAFMPLHLHRTLGYNLALSGLLVALIATGGLLYALTAARLIARFGERGLVRYGGAIYGIGMGLVALAAQDALVIAMLVVAGLGLYGMHGTLQVHATQMAPEARGAAVSGFAFFLFAGQSIGSWLGSLTVDVAGTAPILLVSAVGVWLVSEFLRAQIVQRATTRQ
ncbi:MAG: MFS transporter [Burkholderiales bacterium]